MDCLHGRRACIGLRATACYDVHSVLSVVKTDEEQANARKKWEEIRLALAGARHGAFAIADKSRNQT